MTYLNETQEQLWLDALPNNTNDLCPGLNPWPCVSLLSQS